MLRVRKALALWIGAEAGTARHCDQAHRHCQHRGEREADPPAGTAPALLLGLGHGTALLMLCFLVQTAS
jgi:hypothetical protein